MSSVKVGVSRADAEQILGSPIREWVTASGIVYRIYDYDAGAPPNIGEAAAHVFMDIASACAWELFWAAGMMPEYRKRDQMAISYDIDGTVIGIFDHFGDFDALPADGRPVK